MTESTPRPKKTKKSKKIMKCQKKSVGWDALAHTNLFLVTNLVLCFWCFVTGRFGLLFSFISRARLKSGWVVGATFSWKLAKLGFHIRACSWLMVPTWCGPVLTCFFVFSDFIQMSNLSTEFIDCCARQLGGKRLHVQFAWEQTQFDQFCRRNRNQSFVLLTGWILQFLETPVTTLSPGLRD